MCVCIYRDQYAHGVDAVASLSSYQCCYVLGRLLIKNFYHLIGFFVVPACVYELVEDFMAFYRGKHLVID